MGNTQPPEHVEPTHTNDEQAHQGGSQRLIVCHKIHGSMLFPNQLLQMLPKVGAIATLLNTQHNYAMYYTDPAGPATARKSVSQISQQSQLPFALAIHNGHGFESTS